MMGTTLDIFHSSCLNPEKANSFLWRKKRVTLKEVTGCDMQSMVACHVSRFLGPGLFPVLSKSAC